jgi:hypothetical protein
MSPATRLKLKPNPRVGTANKISTSPYRKIVEATQKKKIKQATKSNRPLNPKTIGLRRMLFLVLQKTEVSVCRFPTSSGTL